MKKSIKKDIQTYSMIIGGLLAAAFVITNLYFAFEISQGFSFVEGLLPELMNTVVIAVVLLLPAFALWMRKGQSAFMQKVSILYPVLLALGLGNVVVADDPLAAGLPMILIVMPFCIIFGLTVLVKRR